MALLSWLMRKGPVGNTAREIGDLYAELRREQPSCTPEATARQVGHRYGSQVADSTGLRPLACWLIERRTGKDPRAERIQDFMKKDTDAKLAKEIIIDELQKRGVPTHLIK